MRRSKILIFVLLFTFIMLFVSNFKVDASANTNESLSIEGVDVLLTDDSDILLPGFDHGFIGGSCFMADAKTLAVNGNIELHSSCKKIKEFCNLHSVSLLSLSRNPVMDIGSFIPVF